MQLFRWSTPEGNFGDDLNDWFWDDVLPGWRDAAPDAVLVGIGSILTTNLQVPPGRKIVVGSGAGYGQPPLLEPRDEWDVRFVRGPRTAEVLALPAAAAITDPAALLWRLPRFNGRRVTGRRPLFVPHLYSDLHPQFDWRLISEMAGAEYLSPRGNPDGVIRAIAGAPMVLAESLHAAIVADTFRVPWVPISTGLGNIKLFKWQDWWDSLQLPHPRIINLLGPIQRLRRLAPRRSGAPRPQPAALLAVSGSTGLGEVRSGPRAWLGEAFRTRVAAHSLKRAMGGPTQLSDEAVLDEALDRMTLAFRDLADDCGCSATL